jgi:hypothetical protein
VGEGVAFGNAELRWKFLEFTALKQRLEFMLHGFFDAGQTVKAHPVDRSLVPYMNPEDPGLFDQSFDSMHLAAGVGLHVMLEKNFIIAIDYGRAFDARDGVSGLYFTVGNVF